jgi:hypothetical protein
MDDRLTLDQVHAWQHNANDTAPVGLIEGIADWVRLKDGFVFIANALIR